jgi:hypothetical protein
VLPPRSCGATSSGGASLIKAEETLQFRSAALLSAPISSRYSSSHDQTLNKPLQSARILPVGLRKSCYIISALCIFNRRHLCNTPSRHLHLGTGHFRRKLHGFLSPLIWYFLEGTCNMSKKLRPGDHAYRGTGDSFSNPTIKQTGKMEDLQPIASDVSSSKAPSKPFISVTANIVDITHREDSLGRPYLLWGPNGEIIELNKAYLSQRRKTSPKETNFSGFLIGRHPECDLRIDGARISNRHCVIHKVRIHTDHYTPLVLTTEIR